MSMDHQGAVHVLAAQRYMLGELAGEERERFETHFFSCRACAEEVRTTAEFVDNLKAVFREDAVHERAVQPAGDSWLDRFRRLFAQPAFAFAALALAVVAGYQRFVEMPALRASLEPRAAVTRIVDPSSLRAQGVTIRAAAGDAYVTVPFSFDPPAGATRAQFEFARTAGGAPVHTESVDLSGSTGAGVLVSIPLPVGRMGPGGWHASVRVRQSAGQWSDIVDRYEFSVELD